MQLPFVLVATLLLGQAQAGEIYVIEDPEGEIHFTDSPTAPSYTSILMGLMRAPVPRVNLNLYRHLDDYDELLLRAAERYDVPAELLKAVCLTESGMNPQAVSSAGAQGLMQLMPATAQDMRVSDPFNPRQSIYGGARYLRIQIREFGEFELALAAYNAGPGNVRRYGGIPPFDETQNYVRKVLALYDHFRYQRPVSDPS